MPVGSSPKWTFWLAESDTLEVIAQIKEARNRSLDIALNKPGGARFEVPLSETVLEAAEPIKHALIVYRNNIPVYSGMLWTMDEDLPGNRLAVSSVGWFEILNRRELRQDVSYPRFGSDPFKITGGGIVFSAANGTPGTPEYHPGGLLTQANAQRDTWISAGTNTDQMERIINFQKGEKIGSAISRLSDTEAGFDFFIDPLTRQMDIKNWDEVPDKTDVVLGYGTAPKSIQTLTRQIDPSIMNNRHTAMGKYGGGLAEDLDSQQNYQLFEETSQLSEVVDPNVLLGYAGSEVFFRSRPRILTSFTPFPFKVGGKSPEPFVDYGVGDKILISASRKPRIDYRNQAVRIFGMGVSITNEGNEKISSLQVVPG